MTAARTAVPCCRAFALLALTVCGFATYDSELPTRGNGTSSSSPSSESPGSHTNSSKDEVDNKNASFVFVDAPAGRIRGKLQTIASSRRNGDSGADVHVRAFLGIPFAEPPVGERRFASPVPLRRLSAGDIGHYDATNLAPVRVFLARVWPQSVPRPPSEFEAILLAVCV